MYLTGFADEAGADIDTQIRATRELGWSRIEARNIGKVNIHDMPEDEFDAVCGKLSDAGMEINCFGSAIANWSQQITAPFESTLQQVARAIPRMQRLGTKMIRIMSFAVIKDRDPQDQMAQERFSRLREIHKRFTDAGIMPVHENCDSYGGMGWCYTLELLEQVPGLALVFDMGNCICHDDCIKGKPYPKQSAWEFYQHVKEHIAYIHVKDGIWDAANNKAVFTFPGEGHADVQRIVNDLLAGGYDGGFSMEPHMAAVAHDPSVTSTPQIRYANYVEYGRRFMKLLTQVPSA
jgi:sugar phosphate isomerase/epimerase